MFLYLYVCTGLLELLERFLYFINYMHFPVIVFDVKVIGLGQSKLSSACVTVSAFAMCLGSYATAVARAGRWLA